MTAQATSRARARLTVTDRLQIVAGGSSPHHVRNPGTGENPMAARNRLINRHTIALAVTRLELPVIP
jgi:hypothetical protein